MLEAGFAALSFSETSFMTLRMLGGFVLPAGHLIIDVSETAGFPPPPGGDGLRQASPKRKRGRYGLLRRWKNRHFGLHHRHQGRGRTYPTPPRWSLKTPTALFSAGSASSGDGGRGEWQSYCVLVPNSKNPDARVRFKALCATTDGLQIAQAGLARPRRLLRHPPAWPAPVSHGGPGVDIGLLEQTQNATRDPRLKKPEHAPLRRRLNLLSAQNADRFN